jgi:hypothetical protein
MASAGCPYCGATVTLDAAGNSACGHLRSAMPGPPQAPPAPAAPPPNPGWQQPAPPPNPGWQQPAPPPNPGWQQQSGYLAPAPVKPGCGCGRVVGCLLLLVVAAVIGIVALLAATGGFSIDIGGTGNGTYIPPANAPLEGTITVAGAEPITMQTIDPGVAATITAPTGGPIPGLAIQVPAGAFSSATPFTISASAITVSGYDSRITAISPLITVENGGGYAAAPITVTVPVTIPAGSFALGFYRHADGSLEPMPLIDETATSITIATRHFSAFFIALVAEKSLPNNIGTGFRPREDEFQTPNYGSYLAPNGHCAGQSLAEMWYFTERKAKGAPQLWGLTDNNGRGVTADFWQDDAYAYRLSSSVHRDLDWETISGTIELAFEKAKVDRLQWFAFRYAMLITGQPQFVGLSEGMEDGGHVIVAYAATQTGLWVADPNYPGELRSILWNEGPKSFTTYESGANAKSSKYHFDKIAFYGSTSLVEWDKIGSHWAEVDAGTIGNDRFPKSDLMTRVKNPDGTTTWLGFREGTALTTTTPELGFLAADPKIAMRATLYIDTRQVAVLEPNGTAPDIKTVKLDLGRNNIGVFIEAFRNLEWNPVDFWRFEVTTPAPLPSTGMETPDATATPASSGYDCTQPKPTSQIGELDWLMHCQGIGG